MQHTKSISVASDYLSCLLSGIPDPFDIPEPIRLQPDITLLVAYTNYVSFVSDAYKQDLSLTYETGKLQRWANTLDPQLVKAYLYDIAFSICKELHYAYNNNGEGTIILPVGPEETTTYASEIIIQENELIQRYADPMLTWVNARGFYLQHHAELNHNYYLYIVALYIYAQACNGNSRGLRIDWNID